jgi:hypothetical protein
VFEPPEVYTRGPEHSIISPQQSSRGLREEVSLMAKGRSMQKEKKKPKKNKK